MPNIRTQWDMEGCKIWPIHEVGQLLLWIPGRAIFPAGKGLPLTESRIAPSHQHFPAWETKLLPVTLAERKDCSQSCCLGAQNALSQTASLLSCIKGLPVAQVARTCRTCRTCRIVELPSYKKDWIKYSFKKLVSLLDSNFPRTRKKKQVSQSLYRHRDHGESL